MEGLELIQRMRYHRGRARSIQSGAVVSAECAGYFPPGSAKASESMASISRCGSVATSSLGYECNVTLFIRLHSYACTVLAVSPSLGEDIKARVPNRFIHNQPQSSLHGTSLSHKSFVVTLLRPLGNHTTHNPQLDRLYLQPQLSLFAARGDFSYK